MLSVRRDYGAGLVESKPGRAAARPSLRSPFALAWRQQRTSFWSWFIGMVLVWGATGTLIPDIAAMGQQGIADNPVFEQIFGVDPAQGADFFTAQFLDIMGLFIALLFAAYAISTFNRIRSEETSLRLEQLLGTPVSRGRVLGAQLVVVGVGTIAMMLASMIAMWGGAVSAGMDSPGGDRYLLTAIVYLAALAVYTGVAAALFGWFPGAVQWSWALIAYTFVFGLFGGIFNAPSGMQWINPLHWAPATFSTDMHVGGFVGLLVAAAVLFAVAFVGFRRRDVPTL
jgi:ABC-2 type transport system permease protein